MMLIYVIVLSRAVPLLFWLSLCLVSARFLHDIFHRKGLDLAARVVFVSVLVFGVIMTVPYVHRASLFVSSEVAYGQSKWPVVVDRLTTYESLGGELDELSRQQLAIALMNLRLWSAAERELVASSVIVNGQRGYTPGTIIQIGMCRYYQGRLAEAHAALVVDDGGASDGYLRHYFLGRLSEAVGDTAGSLVHYQRALGLRANFLPAVYQLVRGDLLLGQGAAAARTLAQFEMAYRGLEQNRDYQQMKAAVASPQGTLPAREFYIVQS